MEKPEIDFHPEPAPGDLVIEDVVIGDGPEAVAGGTVTVHYVGVDYVTGEQFDASWDRGAPATFPLNGLIAAWQEGIPGMKVGGRRKLICPPHTAYGTSGGHRLSGATLIFMIDLLQVA
jgi:peptidylprolyl isomerase